MREELRGEVLPVGTTCEFPERKVAQDRKPDKLCLGNPYRIIPGRRPGKRGLCRSRLAPLSVPSRSVLSWCRAIGGRLARLPIPPSFADFRGRLPSGMLLLSQGNTRGLFGGRLP